MFQQMFEGKSVEERCVKHHADTREHYADSASWWCQVAAGVYHAAWTYGCCGKSD